MKPTECLKALGCAYTYNFWNNECFRTGLLLGVIVSFLPLAVESLISGTGSGNVLAEVGTHPFYFVFLAHPLLFGLIFGAMGTIKRDLDRRHHQDVTMLSGLAMTDPLTGLYNRRY